MFITAVCVTRCRFFAIFSLATEGMRCTKRKRFLYPEVSRQFVFDLSSIFSLNLICQLILITHLFGIVVIVRRIKVLVIFGNQFPGLSKVKCDIDHEQGVCTLHFLTPIYM